MFVSRQGTDNMRRADRLFEIIQILRRSRAPITADTMAAELETSKRSVYRDIAALMAQRVPIRGEAGVGYVLDRGFDMPPLMLTTEEIEAAVLGAHWVMSRGDPELQKAARSLLAKIETTVPEHLQPYIEQPSTSITPMWESYEISVSLADLRNAIRSGRRVRLEYEDGEGAVTHRIVWPVVLGYMETKRMLGAWCELRGAFRSFRADRMQVAEVLDEKYPERPAILRKRWDAYVEEEGRRCAAEYMVPHQRPAPPVAVAAK